MIEEFCAIFNVLFTETLGHKLLNQMAEDEGFGIVE